MEEPVHVRLQQRWRLRGAIPSCKGTHKLCRNIDLGAERCWVTSSTPPACPAPVDNLWPDPDCLDQALQRCRLLGPRQLQRGAGSHAISSAAAAGGTSVVPGCLKDEHLRCSNTVRSHPEAAHRRSRVAAYTHDSSRGLQQVAAAAVARTALAALMSYLEEAEKADGIELGVHERPFAHALAAPRQHFLHMAPTTTR